MKRVCHTNVGWNKLKVGRIYALEGNRQLAKYLTLDEKENPRECVGGLPPTQPFTLVQKRTIARVNSSKTSSSR